MGVVFICRSIDWGGKKGGGGRVVFSLYNWECGIVVREGAGFLECGVMVMDVDRCRFGRGFWVVGMVALAVGFGVWGCSDGGGGEDPDVDVGEDVTVSEDAGDGGDEPVPPLVSHSLWSQLSEEEDPLATVRPQEVDCPQEAIKTETLDGQMSYAVNMEKCNYLAVSQPSLLAVDEGDGVRARIWHFELTPAIGGESAEAYVAITFDGDLAWETTVPIPSDGQLLTPEWVAERDYPRGTEVSFHLKNHGDNQWNFIELVRLDD